MAGIKIVDLPAVGRDLAATDLFEMSLAGGTGSRKITGQEIMNASKLSVNNTPVINGTAGRIFFQGSTNVLQQSGSLFWDNTNGRLGIGTNTPLGILHLKETATTTRMVMDGDAGQSKIITFRTNGLQRFGFYLNNIAESGGNAGSNFAVRAYNDAGSLLSTPLYIHRNSGNIGINTITDAGFKLDVNGNSRINGNLRVNNIIGDTGNLVIESGNSQSYVQIKPKVGNTDGIRIETDQTDIGTTGEWSSFRVLGPIFSPTSGTRSRNFLAVTPTINQTGGANGITRGLFVNPTLTAAADFRAIETTAGKVIFNGGNVGIGTSSPAFPLDVTGFARVNALRFQFSTYAQIAVAYAPYPTARTFFDYEYELSFRNTSGGGTTFIIHNTTNNIGINATTDAGYKLDVNGTARFIGRIDAGSFTPGAAASLYTIATTGRICAGSGIYFRTPLVGDTDLTGFNSSNNDTQINVNINNQVPFVFSGPGGSTATIALANPGFNPTSGTGDKNIFEVAGAYQTSGTYSGIIRGFYYNPNLVSMTGVTAHYAWHSTSGRVRFEGLPTSPTGLTAGELWNNGGVINIV